MITDSVEFTPPETRTVNSQDQPETRRRCGSCGGTFKNERGVKIHQGKTKCKEKPKQRKEANTMLAYVSASNKSQEDQSQETNHRAPDLQVEATQSTEVNPEAVEEAIQERKERLQLPPATDKRWSVLDHNLEAILDNTLKGDASKKLQAMAKIVYEECSTTFGKKEAKKRSCPAGPSRRQREIARLRQEQRCLRKRWRKAPVSQREGLQHLQEELHSQLLKLRKAESLRKKQREKRRQRKNFFSDPFKFTSNLLGKPKSGRLECSQDEVEESVREAHSDPDRSTPLGDCPYRIPSPEPEVPFDESDLRPEEIKRVVKRARAKSAPGPSGTTYKIYKNCPKLLSRLCKLLRTSWKKKQLPPAWTLAEGCFVPKEDKSKGLGQFREISLLDVEGKIFWAVIATRLTSYLLVNKYVDPSVQKGGIPGHSGCLEHTASVSQLIKEANKDKKKIISVV